MKRAAMLFILAVLLAGCGEEGRAIFGSITPVPKNTPEPKATPTPVPKRGNWMWNERKDPLNGPSK